MEKKIAMAVFDWAGTTVDYGSSAPVAVFDLVFREAGVVLSREEINGPMGLEKRAHIRQLLQLESAAKQWEEKYGRMWTEEDVDHLYEKFESSLAQVVTEYSAPIDGVVETVEKLREMGIKIGSTTGYTDEMMEIVVPAAAQKGYSPDCWFSPNSVGNFGRPYPYMIFENLKKLEVTAVSAAVKVGDTVADIREGLAAGMLSLGIVEGSSVMGLTEAEYAALSPEEQADRCRKVEEKFLAAGASAVLRNLSELPAYLEGLER